MAQCTPCELGFCFECVKPEEINNELYECCCRSEKLTDPPVPDVDVTELDEEEIVERIRGEGYKSRENVRDPMSTGRKRAVLIAPIEPGKTKCEWAGLRYAGGGKYPIIGCVGNPAKNVHHGPNKDTLDNRPENLHRICSYCHNRWHALNDPDYATYRASVEEPQSHDAETMATIYEVMANEAAYKNLEKAPVNPT